jgi:hypothetical protein
MRTNVYGEELTAEVAAVTTTADTGKQFWGLRLFLKSPPELHRTETDDDRSAVTIWVPYTNLNGHNTALVENLLSNMMRCLDHISVTEGNGNIDFVETQWALHEAEAEATRLGGVIMEHHADFAKVSTIARHATAKGITKRAKQRALLQIAEIVK